MTDFFERADMLDTKVGAARKQPPSEVAGVGFEAMLKGDGDVVAGWSNKLRAAIAHIVPSSVLAEQHRQMAAPGTASRREREPALPSARRQCCQVWHCHSPARSHVRTGTHTRISKGDSMTKTMAGRFGMALAGMFLIVGTAGAAPPPATADVLAKLHLSNQKEIEMGKQAQKNGQSKDVKAFGKTLVKDHTAADKKVAALAKKEKIDLAASTPPAKEDMPAPAAGPDFDAKFGQMMLDDHKKDIGEATNAQSATTDGQLKKLIADILPTLQKHQELAQKIVDAPGKK